MSAGENETFSDDLTPRRLVQELDRYIIGQADAKRAVSIAVRNRWRRRRLNQELRQDVTPKNILMIGPTGVGKTEIARRLAKLTGAPFIKVEATKYTEVGYYGRDVESMIRELVDAAIALVRESERSRIEPQARERAEEKLLDLLCPRPSSLTSRSKAAPVGFAAPLTEALERLNVENAGQSPTESSSESEAQQESAEAAYQRTRSKLAAMLARGELEQRKVEISVEAKSEPMMLGMGRLENMDLDLQKVFERVMPRSTSRREVTVSDARKTLIEQEVEALLDLDKIHGQAVELAENQGIIFLDEIDKIVASEARGADVSRHGVQRDLLPIVEGTTVQTRYGYVKTDHILFIAAGAFHRSQPSELMPELQGRFPIRVELKGLDKADFERILREPRNSLLKQYAALLDTEGVQLEFTDEAIDLLAHYADQVNRTTQNIGARRLATILERLLEELSFEAPEMRIGRVVIDRAYVEQRLDAVAQDEDLSRYIL